MATSPKPAKKAAKRTAAKRGGGQPTKCTPQTIAQVAEGIRKLHTAEEAARRAGIGERTFYQWMKRADPDDPDHRAEYAQFAQEVTCAKADREQGLAAKIDTAADDDWRAAGWLLERLHPERWSLKHLIELTGAQGGPVRVETKVVEPVSAEHAAKTVDALIEAGIIAPDATPGQVAAALAALQ